jgi:hypothetical protein
MHGEYNVKFSVAQQANTIYKFQRLKEKIHKTNASIWFNKGQSFNKEIKDKTCFGAFVGVS